MDRFKFRVFNKKSNNYIKEKMFYIDEFGKLFKYKKSKSTVYINAPSPYVMCFCGDNYIVEQCTGLKDKNGNLIYEGDILDFYLSEPRNGGHYKGFVEWSEQNEFIGWRISDMERSGCWDLRQIAHPNDWMVWGEIIGNIHEELSEK